MCNDTKTLKKRKGQNSGGGGGEHPQLTTQIHLEVEGGSPPLGVHTEVTRLRPNVAKHFFSHPSFSFSLIMQSPIYFAHLHFVPASSSDPALLL